MKLRKFFFWLHLAAGTVAGVVILIMSTTGVLLMYQRQIVHWADRDFRVNPQPPRLPLDAILEKFRQTKGVLPSAIALRSDPAEPVALTVGRDSFYANPYTGEILGVSSVKAREFFRVITDWHRWLGREGPIRPAGRAITGACNLAFLFLVGSGFYLWWPRKWGWRNIKPVVVFRRGLSGRPRDFNWHNVIGLWSCIPLFFVVLTGALISYPWATSLLYTLTRSAPPPSSQAGASNRPPAPDLDVNGLDPLWARAEKQVPRWRTIALRLPNSSRAPLTFTIDEGTAGQPQLRSQLTLDRAGNVVRWENFETYNLGRRLRSWGRFIHTGEAFGFPGQTIAGIASAGAAVLVWTGLALALRRFRSWRARRAAPAEVTAEA